jgi:uncharacterized membrane protein
MRGLGRRAFKDAGPGPSQLLRTDSARVEVFSDAVMAVAITLLVLDLRWPGRARGHLLAGLLGQWPAYLGCVTSFLYIAVIWLNHHQAFARIKTVDRGLHFANIAVLFTVALVPFSTELLADAIREGNRDDADIAIVVYTLIAGVMMSAAWWWLLRHLTRHPDLVHDTYVHYFPQAQLRSGLGIAGYAVGGVLGYLVNPAAALIVFFLMPALFALSAEGLLPARQPPGSSPGPG